MSFSPSQRYSSTSMMDHSPTSTIFETSSISEHTKSRPPPPQRASAGFFDAAIASARATYFKMAGAGVAIIALVIFGVLPLFWGAVYAKPKPITGWVVDFDRSSVGSFVSTALESSPISTIRWEIVSASLFPGGPSELAQAIKDEKAWVAISINPNATFNLQAAVTSADSLYNGSLAITAYAAEARQETAFRSFIRPNLQATLPAIAQAFARSHAQQLSALSNSSALIAAVPQLATTPISYTIHNLIPFDIPVATAVTFVGLIYLLILAFFLLNIAFQARVISGIEHTLSTASLLKVRITTAFVQYLFLSLFYTLLSRAFQLDFSRSFGAGGFPLLWMVNFCGMLALGLALESMLTLLTTRFVGFFLLPWVVVNVSSAVLPVEVEYNLYRYAYAMPFYNISKAVRTIVFGTKNELGLNFGILLAWTVLSLVTMSIFQLHIRHRSHSAALAAYEKELLSEGEEVEQATTKPIVSQV
ncbi:hypothetical protein DL96DRAFT_1675041 [Flagelloscypha sp. PMI_526]|nr:hypothetical protein DL96DRAFT_1675041 [Flagelloscypha sp. PMI_526]